MKARESLGGDGNYLKKLNSAKKAEKDFEDRQSKLYIKQMLERRQVDEKKREASRKNTEEELHHRYELIEEKEYI